MLIHFQLQKVIQASAVLLKAEQSRCMSRLRLLKLLYIADREALVERARPILGDRACAMDHGPVLSRTYDLIKGADFGSPTWGRHFKSFGRDVQLVEEPGVGDLSKYEIEKLLDVAKRFIEWNDWAVAEYTHGYQEYIKNRPVSGGSNPISTDDMLTAAGRLDQKEAIEAQYHAEAVADHFLNT